MLPIQKYFQSADKRSSFLKGHAEPIKFRILEPFVLLFSVKIVAGNIDSFMAQKATNFFIPFGNLRLAYTTLEFNLCYSNGQKQDFSILIGSV